MLPRRRDLSHRTVGQEILVRDPATGKVHFLNGTAALIWECCDGATTLEDCVSRLRQAYSVPADADLAADVRETLSGFRERGLVDAGAGG